MCTEAWLVGTWVQEKGLENGVLVVCGRPGEAGHRNVLLLVVN